MPVKPRAERTAVPVTPKSKPVPRAPAAQPDPPNPFAEFLARYRNDPVAFVQDVLGATPDAWQAEVLNAYAGRVGPDARRIERPRRMSIRSGHGVGKTTCLAWIIIHHCVCRFPQKTVCTAPTTAQLFDALMAETKAWLKKLPEALQGLYEIKSERIELIAAPEESFIAFRTSSPEKPEALAGVHSDYVLLVADEASGIPEAIYEAASGSMSGHNALTLLAGNPVRTNGLFFDTHHDLAGMWWTRKVSCHDSPRCTPDFFADMAARYGVDSNAYRVRVLGEFPTAEANTVIPFELLEAALERDVKPKRVRPTWGLDVARQGDDKNALAQRQGNVLLKPVEEWSSQDLMVVSGKVKAEWDATPATDRPESINIDIIGIGAGVHDRLRELGLPVRGVNVAESAAMTDRFDRLRSELWWLGREWLEKRDCSLANDKALAAELGRPTYEYTSTGKIKVEGKKETKKRTKKPSPNKADAFLLSLGTDVMIAGGVESTPMNWSKPLQRDLGTLV
jgi:phage terminase large subunit